MNNVRNINFNYDKEVDVLYATTGKPQKATSLEVGNGTVIRINPKTKKVIGFTVTHYMKRINKGLLKSIPLFEGLDLPKF
jgi:uncharacterized protein YuzE